MLTLGVFDLEVEGDFVCDSQSVLASTLESDTAFGRLQITGVATLAGKLETELAPEYVPAQGTAFDLVSYGSRTGAFLVIESGDITYDETYEDNALVLTVLSNSLLNIVDASPKNGDRLAPPAEIRFEFSAEVDPDSVEASDCEIVPPLDSGVPTVDGNVVVFPLAAPDTDDDYTYILLPGAIEGVNGEMNPEFSATFHVDVTPPWIVSHAPESVLGEPISEITFDFNEDILATMVDQIVSFTGPGGIDLLDAITGIATTGSQVTVAFEEQSLAGDYQLTIGPHIQDLVGHEMDQNGNAVPGEPEDVYDAVVSLIMPADLAVDSVAHALTATSGEAVSVVWSVSNQGGGQTDADSWTDRVTLIGENGDSWEFGFEQGPLVSADDLQEGEFYYGRQEFLPLADNMEGIYRVLVETDVFGEVFEDGNTDNNRREAVADLVVVQPSRPDLRVADISHSPIGHQGNGIEIKVTIVNDGAAPAEGEWVDEIVLPSGEQEPTRIRIPHPEDSQDPDGLLPGKSYDVLVPWHVPDGLMDGTYTITVYADSVEGTENPWGALFESNEDNNGATSQIELRHPDLVPIIEDAPASATAGLAIPVRWTVTNEGSSEAPGQWADRFYLDNGDGVRTGPLDSLGHVGPLSNEPGRNNYTEELVVILPVDISGDWKLLVITDDRDDVEEGPDEGNNTDSWDISIEPAPYADLTVTDIRVEPGYAGDPVRTIGDPAKLTVFWAVANIGPDRGLADRWIDRIYASTDDQPGGDVLLFELEHQGGLDPQHTYKQTQTFYLPPSFEGRYHIIVCTDAGNRVYENGNDGDNCDIAPRQLEAMPIPFADLEIENADILDKSGSPTDTLDTGQTFKVMWKVLNSGIAHTNRSSWVDTLSLAADPEGNEIVAGLGGFSHFGTLSQNGSYERIPKVTVPDELEDPGEEGTYYIVAETNAGRNVFEFLNHDNNRVVLGPITIRGVQRPDLEVLDIVAPTLGVTARSIIEIGWTVQNKEGAADAVGSWTDAVALVNVNDDTDVIHLGSFVYERPESSAFLPGQSYKRTERFYLSENFLGEYRARVTTNVSGSLLEDSYANTLIDDTAFQITLPPLPDLIVAAIDAPAEVEAGQPMSITFDVTNTGSAEAQGEWFDEVYLSLDHVPSDDDTMVRVPNPAAIGDVQSGTNGYTSQVVTFDVPKRFRGNVFVFVKTDSENDVWELGEDNNTLLRQILIKDIVPADLVTSDIVAPDFAMAGTSIEVRYRVTNKGSGETNAERWTDAIWLTRDQNRPHPGRNSKKPEDISLDPTEHIGTLLGRPDEGFYEQTVMVNIPFSVSPGEYFIAPWADAYDVVLEDTFDVNPNPEDPNELDANNYAFRPITIFGHPDPVEPESDLVVSQIVAPDSATGGDSLHVEWTVTNVGPDDTEWPIFYEEGVAAWSDAVYLSTSPDPDAEGALTWWIGSVRHLEKLGKGASYTASLDVELSPEVSGQYLIVRAGSDPREQIRDNNTAARPISVVKALPADLEIASIDVVSTDNRSGEEVTVRWTVTNAGSSVWPDTEYWTDTVYVSADPQLIPGRALAVESFAREHNVPLEAGKSYTQEEKIVLPRGIEGEFFLYVHTNSGGRAIPPSGHLSNQDSLAHLASNAYEDLDDNLARATFGVSYYEPDLRVEELVVVTADPRAGHPLEVQWTAANTGNRATRETGWLDRVFLSYDASLDANDMLLATVEHTGVLLDEQQYQSSAVAALPPEFGGEFYILVFVDSNLEVGHPKKRSAGRPHDYAYRWPDPLLKGEERLFYSLRSEGRIDPNMARVAEYRDEGNNISGAPMTVLPGPSVDLQVSELSFAPGQVDSGQAFTLTYEVTNAGDADTPAEQDIWDDLFYLSADENLDLRADLFVGHLPHSGGLQAGTSYTETTTIHTPAGIVDEAFYVFVVTDPVQVAGKPRGSVRELGAERNNDIHSASKVVIKQPPPSDLIVDEIEVSEGSSSDEIIVTWTVFNQGENQASGRWTDAVYLSDDPIWDVSDRRLGNFEYEGIVMPGESTSQLSETVVVPPVIPGQYRVIVRTDVFNQIYEDSGEWNNRTVSPGVITVTAEPLAIGQPLVTEVSSSRGRLYELEITEPRGTMQIDLDPIEPESSFQLLLRYEDVPDDVTFDFMSLGGLAATPSIVIPDAQIGNYYLVVRGSTDIPFTLLADYLSLRITDVRQDTGGDSRYVTTTISGAQFDENAIVKLVKPGFAEYEPVRYDVVDRTKIVATFDLRDASHGLYDVKVINPGGEEAIVPYRYLVERALEPDVTVGLGGPRVLAPGDVGTYGFSLQSLTNVDTPYVQFQYGVPDLGINEALLNLEYLVFTTNLRGNPDPRVASDEVWATLDSIVETGGRFLAPGYAFDLEASGYVGRTFNAHTYPGLKAIMAAAFEDLRNGYEKIASRYSDVLTEDPASLDNVFPGLYSLYQLAERLVNPLEDIDPCDVAFQFPIMASATVMTREEFVQRQTDDALDLRAQILADETASQALVTLAADADSWVDLFLAALEEAGLLREEDEAPAVRTRPRVLSLLATLASGVAIGTGDEVFRSDRDLTEFFGRLREWYHGTEPTFNLADAGLSNNTHSVSFNVYVPFSNRNGKCDLDVPPGAPITPPDFSRFFDPVGELDNLATLTGPVEFGQEQFVSQGQALPYTIGFENPPGTASSVRQIEVITELDPNLDPRSFQLGDLHLGDIDVNIPAGRSSFQADFDFTGSKGFVLRVVAGVDIQPGQAVARWSLQAIDPNTGEVLTDETLGLLSPNNPQGHGRGSVSYSVSPNRSLATGNQLRASARVFFDSGIPQDTVELRNTIDAAPPRTILTQQSLAEGTKDYLVEWSSVDDEDGSGVKHVTVYVAEDGGDFKIWLRQTNETSDTYHGTPGHTYEFLALAVDNAGNRELPRPGILAPDDGSAVNLGTLPDVGSTTPSHPELPPEPSTDPSPNPFFVQAQEGIPAFLPTTHTSEFTEVLRPFIAEAFATGISQSHADIGPMAILELADGSILVSGGAARNEVLHFSELGGEASHPWTTLPYPVFDMALAEDGRIWAATGGGPLIELDPVSGDVIGVYGDGFTQSLAIEPATGLIYVSSRAGVERFDPTNELWERFSQIRVGNLAFAPDGTLWAATWPNRGDIVRFDERGHEELMLRLDSQVDSLAFGKPGTDLDGSLFVSNNDGPGDDPVGYLAMIDLATLQQVILATGGSRGDIVKTTSDGRVLISQSHQVDILRIAQPPVVVSTSPPSDAIVPLPLGYITITFDQEMFVSSDDDASVTNPDHYSLWADDGTQVTISSVDYDTDSRTAVLLFDSLVPDEYHVQVSENVESAARARHGVSYQWTFTAVDDLSAAVDLRFSNTRAHRGEGTVSYDVAVTNTSTRNVLLPMVLVLDPPSSFVGIPDTPYEETEDRLWLIDLGGNMPPDSVLAPGASTIAQTITIQNLRWQGPDVAHTLFALPEANQPPVFVSSPMESAVVGEPYSYTAQATDQDGVVATYVLPVAPEGMTIDPISGDITWLPEASDEVLVDVVIRVYDSYGAYADQRFNIELSDANQSPVVIDLPNEIVVREGDPIELGIFATDPDGDPLQFWADGLPPGSLFDSRQHVFRWTPDFDAAGTYPDVAFFVGDGYHRVQTNATFLVAPRNRAPAFAQPVDRVVREGDPVHIQLIAEDAEDSRLEFSSNMLPAGATLDSATGRFIWTPGFSQAGTHTIPFQVSDSELTDTVTVSITVADVNAPPRFDELGHWRAYEGGSAIRFFAFAFDPDNPGYEPQIRLSDGSLTPLEGTLPTVTYSSSGLPPSATFDTETGEFIWAPGYDDEGEYTVTFTANDSDEQTTIDVPITVVNVNRPPQIDASGMDGTVTVGRGGLLEINVTATDVDGTSPTLSARGTVGYPLPQFVTFVNSADGTGLLTVTPDDGDRGNYTITIIATDNESDGSRAQLTSEHVFNVLVDVPNERPLLEPIGSKVAVVGELIEFVVQAHDPDREGLDFTLSGLPAGANLEPGPDFQTMVFRWTPTTVGEHTAEILVTDDGNQGQFPSLSDIQSFDIIVRTVNLAPVLVPPPVLVVRESTENAEKATLQLIAVDPDSDDLTFSANNLPDWASLDPLTGILSATPHLFAAGTYDNITVYATDGNRISSAPLTIQVDNLNQPPTLVPLFIQTGREGVPLEFAVVAGDIDQETLVYRADSELPQGADFDPDSGLFRWTPDFSHAGNYTVSFSVTDPQGLTDQMDVELFIADVNRSPSLDVSNHAVALGHPLEFVLDGFDPDPDATLLYSVASGQLPIGATLDETAGQFTWTPGAGQAGDYPLVFQVTDGQTVTRRGALIRAMLQPEAPVVTIELTPSFPVLPGQRVVVHPLASSLADIVDLTIAANGSPVGLDDMGRATITVGDPGKILVKAQATDADGLLGTATTFIRVKDPDDDEAPLVSLDRALDGAMLTEITDIVATVDDDNLDTWSLELAPQGQPEFVLLAQGEQTVVRGTIARFDPATVANGFYQLRLTATDINGLQSTVETLVEANTEVKDAQFVHIETDLTVTLGGVPLEIARRYDSLNQSSLGSFGFGWSWLEHDVNIQTNVDSVADALPAASRGFQLGTRLYLTLPGGERVAFTFTPEKHELPGITYHTPHWQADTGVSYTLQSTHALLTLAGQRCYELKTGTPYNPGSGLFDGPEYTLTSPDGNIYHLSTARGIEELTTPSGERLVFSDSGIVSSDGHAITFIRDAAGRITSVTAPDGRQVIYTYDADSLLAVHRLYSGDSSRYGYNAQTGLLDVLISPADRAVVDYTTEPLSTLPIDADLGTVTTFGGAPTAGNLAAGSTDRFIFALRDSEIASTQNGIVLIGVQITANDDSTLQPAVPAIPGLVPQISHADADGSFALFAIDRSGLQLLELSGTDALTAGDYTLDIFIAGDANFDGVVDGTDAEIIVGAIGQTCGQPGYLPGADPNRDCLIDSADVQLLGGMMGFASNQVPTVAPTSVLTHTDLPVPVALSEIAQDPELDPIFVTIVATQHGTATPGPGGQSIIFTPTPGYSGPADVTIRATDGFGVSEPVTIDVDVSDAPLVNVDIVERARLIAVGGSFELTVTGDFADQTGVELPGSYVSYMSEDPNIATITTEGLVAGRDIGSTVLLVSTRGLQAVTVVNVRDPLDEYADLDYIGLGVYPQAIALPAHGGTRQLSASIDGSYDVTADSSFYIANSTVVEVSQEGLVTALESGSATVTVIYAGQEMQVPIHVEAPRTGPAVLDNAGGVVQGSDGSIVQVPPGALVENTEISIAPVPVDDLSMPVPEWLNSLGAFRLEVGGNSLQLAPLLAVPVPAGTPVGTEVYFYHEGIVPDENGAPMSAWIEVEVGIVCDDGMARTTSPPFGGPRYSGRYLYAAAQTEATVGLLQVQLATMMGMSYVEASLMIPGGLAVFGVSMATAMVDTAFSSMYIADALALHLPTGHHEATLRVTPYAGDPISKPIEVTIDPGLNEFYQMIEMGEIDEHSPIISSLEVDWTTIGTDKVGLTIQGDKYETSATYEVSFTMGDSSPAIASAIRISDTELYVDEIPASVILGTCDIQVIKHGGAIDLESNITRFVYSNQFAFVTKPDSGRLELLDVNDIGGNPRFAEIVLENENSKPTHVASTSDDLRVYVVLEKAGGIAVVDTLAVRQFAFIDLFGMVRPREILVDPNDEFIYVSDSSSPLISVIDIRLGSPTFHQVVSTISFGDDAPSGLRAMAITNDATQLLVAAPNRGSAYGPPPSSDPSGNIIVVDISTSFNGFPLGLQEQAIEVGDYPYGLATTPDPDRIAFTNFANDRQGFGVLARSPSGSWTLSQPYVDLTLGTHLDSFDVSSARDIVFDPNGPYAFVLGYNMMDPGIPSRNHNVAWKSPYPAGSNIGIIENPLSVDANGNPATPKLVAATTPIPYGFPMDFSISPEGTRLYMPTLGINASGGLTSALYVYDVPEMISTVKTNRGLLDTKSVDDIDSTTIFANPIGLNARLWGIELQDHAEFGKLSVDGLFGDIIEVDLRELLGNARIGFAEGSFVLPDQAAGSGRIATFGAAGLVVQGNMTSSGGFGEAYGSEFDVPGLGQLNKVTFNETGVFYYVPPIDGDAVRRSGESPQQQDIEVKFKFNSPYGNQHSGSVWLRMSDGYGTLSDQLQSSIGLDFQTPPPHNNPLDVYRVQQRLKYLGFPDEDGNSLVVDGIIGPKTDQAIKLFQASVKAGGNGDPQVNSSGIIVRGGYSESWLSGSDYAPPRWMELIDPDSPGNPQYKLNGGSFDINPGKDSSGVRTGNTQQDERFGTSWAIEIIREATSGDPTQIINSFSEEGYTSGHIEHKAGLDIDVHIAGKDILARTNYNNGSSNVPVQLLSNPVAAWNAATGQQPNTSPNPTADSLTILEKAVIQNIVAFYDAAGNMYQSTYVGDAQDDDTGASGDHNGYRRIHQVLTALGVTAEGMGGHRNHFHVSLKPPGSPLLAQGDATLTLPSDDLLLPEDLSPILTGAIDQWTNAGLGLNNTGIIRSTDVQITDLSDGVLAMASPGSDGHSALIQIDIDAAGHGWFIDATPSGDSEFDLSFTESRFRASEDSPAFGQVDLLTVLMHEMGHVLGSPDVPESEQAYSIMTTPLAPGVRRIPTAADLAWLQTETTTTSDVTFTDPEAIIAPAVHATHEADASVVSPGPTLYEELAGPPPKNTGLLNGDFDVDNPSNAEFGWATLGGGSVVADQAQLDEHASVFTRFEQSFLIPEDATALSFTIVMAELGATASRPGDAFEVALLDAQTNAPLVTSAAGLTKTDSLLNIQHDGQAYFGSQVTVPDTHQSGDVVSWDAPVEIIVDLSGVAAETKATLFFDLFGFGELDSRVVIDNIRFVGLGEPGILVTPTTGLETTEDGGTAEFSVVLAAAPTSKVVVPISSTDETEGVLSIDRLVFTPENWHQSQAVTVTGVNDLEQDGPVPYMIATAWAISADPDYHGMDADDVTVVNLDNAPGFIIMPTDGLITTEQGGTAEFTVTLTTRPSADVRLNLFSTNAGEGTTAPSGLKFSPENWDVPQVVTITGVDDSVADGDTSYRIVTAWAVSDDPTYHGINPSDVMVVNLDDEPGIIVTPTTDLVTAEQGGTAEFSVVLNTQPSAEVRLNLFSTNTREGTIAESSLRFTSEDWNVPQVVTITGVDDTQVDGDVAYRIITAWSTSHDPLYHGIDPADVSVVNLDDDGKDDTYGPNDSLAEAYDLSDHEGKWLAAIAGPGVQADDDWYAIDVGPDQRHLAVELNSQSAEGNLDAEVYDANGTLFAVADWSGGNGLIETVLPASGAWYIKVHGDNTGNEYDLLWESSYVHPGDANRDGQTDLSDFNLWNAHKFTSPTDWSTGDFNGDGATDLSDFNIWNAHKFTSAAAPSGKAQRLVVNDAVLSELAEEDADRTASMVGKLAWLYDLDLDTTAERAPKKRSAQENAIDTLLATYWE